MVSCSQCCIFFIVIITIPIYIILALFWHSVNQHWSHIPYYSFGVLNCFLLLIGGIMKHRHMLGLYLLCDGVRLILQICVCIFAILRAAKLDHDDVEKNFGVEGFYKFIQQNVDPEPAKNAIGQIDQVAGYIMIVLAIFAFLDIISTLSRMALAHNMRETHCHKYNGKVLPQVTPNYMATDDKL